MKVKGNKFVEHLAQCLEHRNLCFGWEIKQVILLPLGRVPLLKQILTSHFAYNSRIIYKSSLILHLWNILWI